MNLIKLKLRYPLRQSTGYSLIILSMLFTLIIWLFTLPDYRFIKTDPFLFLSKLVVLVGTIGMCWTFILATRLKCLEEAFIGLDKVYHVHKNLAKLSFLLIFFHPIFQFFRYIPNWSKAFGLFIPTVIGGTEFGLFAFLTFTILIAFTLWIKIPYHIWKRTHEFFIVVLVLTFLHVFFIDKHVNSSKLLSIWMYGFMGLAMISYIYIRFLYWYVGPKYVYSINKIEEIRKKIWNIYLKPADHNELLYKPGQFVYISFENEDLKKEVHPFSISSDPNDSYLRVSIKNLGDYTSKIGKLVLNDKAEVWGPYGYFYEKYLFENNKDAVLVAGGIGITPFLSMVGFEAHNPSIRKTYLFYCVKNSSRADFDQELSQYSQINKSIIYIPYYSEENGFLTAEKIEELIGGLKNKNFFICGPKSMMDSLIGQLTEAGIKNRDISFENFNFLD